MTCPDATNNLACGLPLMTGRAGASHDVMRVLGRPKDVEKREAVLDAASFLFAERGMDGVAIEAIAAVAGVSKVTIYANFKDKAAILDAIVRRETERLAAIEQEIAGLGGPLAARLERFGLALHAMLGAPCHVAVDRCLGLETVRNPDLGRRFFDAGPGYLRSILARILAEAAEQGEIKLDDPKTAAEDLLGLWLGFSSIERRLLCQGAPSQETRAVWVAQKVALFLKANSA